MGRLATLSDEKVIGLSPAKTGDRFGFSTKLENRSPLESVSYKSFRNNTNQKLFLKFDSRFFALIRG
jgi:hypothetical protein